MGLFGNKKKDAGAASGGGKKHAEVGTTIKVQNYNVVVDKQIAEGNFLPPNKKSSKEYYTYEIAGPPLIMTWVLMCTRYTVYTVFNWIRVLTVRANSNSIAHSSAPHLHSIFRVLLHPSS